MHPSSELSYYDISRHMDVIDPNSCYLCVFCLSSSRSLYKQYSSAKNIKLQTCTNCKQDLDPYIERELLLVLMDMMLLRSSSYIHFLFNRKRYILGLIHQGHDEAAKEYIFMHNAIVLTVVTIVIKTMLKCLGKSGSVGLLFMDGSFGSGNSNHYRHYFHFILWSVPDMLGMVVVSFTVIAVLLRLICPKIFSAELPFTALPLDQIYLSILTPQLFHIVTLFVQIYEDSPDVQFLGSIFVACFNFCSMDCMIEGILGTIRASSTSSFDLRISNRFVRKIITALPVVGCFAWEAMDITCGRSLFTPPMLSNVA